MKQADIALKLAAIESQLAAIAQEQVGRSVPAEHVAESLDIIGSNVPRIAELVEAANEQRTRILEIVTWLNERMTNEELQHQFDDVQFVSKQLISIMHGTRADIVQMRATLLRLAALLEQALQAHVEDDALAMQWDGAERRNSTDRRRG